MIMISTIGTFRPTWAVQLTPKRRHAKCFGNLCATFRRSRSPAIGLQMRHIAHSYVFGLGVLLFPVLACSSDDHGQHAPIQLFLKACAITYAHESQVSSALTELGFTELKGVDADQYLLGKPGRAWYGMIESNPYGVALQPNGLCTVFVHVGNASQIQSAVETWLPPASTGISVKKEDLTAQPGLKTTAYELRGGKVRERWVVSIADDPASPVRALISWNKL